MCSEISLENFNVPCLPPVHAQRLKNLSGMFDFNFRLADELYICLSRTARIIIPEIVFWSSGLFFFQKVKHLPLRLPVCWAPPGYSATESYHIQEPNVNHNTTHHQHWLGEMSGSPIHQFLQDTRVHAYIAYLPICTLIYLCVHVPTYDIWITDLQTLLWHLNCLWWLQNFHKTKRMEHYGTPEHPCSTGNTPWCTGRLAESPLTVTVFSNTVGSAMVQSSQYDWYKLIHIATNICKEDSFIVCMCFFSSAKKNGTSFINLSNF